MASMASMTGGKDEIWLIPVDESTIIWICNHLFQAIWMILDDFRGESTSGWWFGTFFIVPYIGKNHPN
jgi:hypothetical protein